MAVTLETVARNAIADSIGGALNSGTLVFQTSGSVTVATCTFAADAFAGANTGVATAGTIVDDTNAVGGVITKALWKTSGAATWLTCTVTAGGGGGDITMTSTTVAAGDTVHVTSLTLTCPAS
jgi:hypothetical protein